jgi:hypothetical protein
MLLIRATILTTKTSLGSTFLYFLVIHLDKPYFEAALIDKTSCKLSYKLITTGDEQIELC